jgi:hypothetical protein
VLHLHARYFQPVHYKFGLPLQQDCSVRDKVQVERLGVVRYRDDLLDPGAQSAQVRQHVADGIVPERVLPHAAALAFALGVFLVLASQTELLQADEIGNV